MHGPAGGARPGAPLRESTLSWSDPLRRRALLALLLAAAGLLAAAAEPPAELPARYREWLEQVELLITEEEREYFLSLREDFRREAFIEKFWQVRDPEPRTSYNELKRRWISRTAEALSSWGSLDDDRSRMLLLNGEPGRFVLPSGRVVARCFHRRRELEIWFYGGSERTAQSFIVLFHRPLLGSDGEYRLWLGGLRLDAERRRRLPSTNPSDFCEESLLAAVVEAIATDPSYPGLIQDLLAPPEPDSREWVATFAAHTTELPEGAETFEVGLDLQFPGRNQNRTAVQGILTVAPEAARALATEEGRQRRFLLTGEVVRDGRLFETFRYQFEIPAADGEEGQIPLVFRRYLRPGEIRVLLKLEDLYGGRFARAGARLEVPSPAGLSLRRAPDSPIFRRLAEANEAAERGQRTIRILPPPEDEIQVGLVRFATATSDDFSHVTFYLDGRPLMTKRRPPFSVELDLGSSAAAHRLRVVAYDASDREAASDEIQMNQGGQRFRVRLSEPRPDRIYRESLGAVVQVVVPDGQTLDRVELFLDDRRVATLYQPPFEHPLLLEDDGLAYVRAVAYLRDGNSAEDVVFVNAPDYFERIEVQYVELFATVSDRRGRPLLDLGRGDFTVWEDDAEQEIRRFEFVRDLPIHAGLLIDTSASMKESLAQVTDAALAFTRQAIQPRDRVALISFNHRPRVDVRFTNLEEEVSAALVGLRAGGSTALYDSLVYALHYFDGVRGQKALLLLSDGEDEASRFDFESALETAQRSGVTVYVIGLAEAARDRDARRVLQKIAAETGGSSFFIEDPSELAAIYGSIQEDLRSRYLIAYQSTSNKDFSQFRHVRVEVADKDAEVRTSSGYYP